MNRKTIVVFIAVTVGMLHFVTGPGYSGPFIAFVNGYMIDILLPFAMYLVLGISNISIFRGSVARGCFVFMIGAVSETLQYFGVPLFGRTFDILDYPMFGIGISLGVIFEKIVLSGYTEKRNPRPDDPT